jgi:hypothetical protein
MSEKLEALLRRIRLSRAREGDPKETLYALLEEIEQATGYSGQRGKHGRSHSVHILQLSS